MCMNYASDFVYLIMSIHLLVIKMKHEHIHILKSCICKYVYIHLEIHPSSIDM
jgi:hypothetical protein